MQQENSSYEFQPQSTSESSISSRELLRENLQRELREHKSEILQELEVLANLLT